MKKLYHLMLVALVVALLVPTVACQKAEEAAEETVEAAGEVMEEAGEMMEEAAEAVEEMGEEVMEEADEEVAAAYGGGQLRFGPDYLIPKPFDTRVLVWEAHAVAKAAIDLGAA